MQNPFHFGARDRGAKPSVLPPVERPDGGAVSAVRSVAVVAPSQIITEASGLPVGEFVDLTKLEKRAVAGVQAESFAVLRSPSGMVYLLASPDANTRMLMEVLARLRLNYGNGTVMSVAQDVIRIVNERNHQAAGGDSVLLESEIEKAAFELLEDAERRGTSDVHIETREDHVQVFFRIYGKRMQMGNLSPKRSEAIHNFLYNWASKDSSRGTGWNKGDVQDTNFGFELKNGTGFLNVRFHSAPIHPQGNYQSVMRLLRPASNAGGFKPLRDVGYTEDQANEITDMIGGGSGIVLIVGPTNSGKSTTLQSAVAEIRQMRGPTIKVSTIENPVEYEMVGACQMASSSEDFKKYLKASLRQDPDVVVVGEIRDEDAAETTKNLVLAGHKILSTLHVYEAPGAISRLIQLGVPRGLLAMPGFLSGIVYQRLLPVVCPRCAHSLESALQEGLVSEALKRRLSRVIHLDRGDEIRFARDGGCEHCDNLGLVGRTPCAEVLKPDSHFLDLIRLERDSEAKKYWIDQLGARIGEAGKPTALTHAIWKMRQGIVDPRDVEAELSLLTAEM